MAVEFMIYFAVFVALAIGAFIVLSIIREDEYPRAQYALLNEVGNSVVGAINFVARSGKGFTYNYTFQKTLLGRNYSVVFRESYVDMGLDDVSQRFDYLPYNYKMEGKCRSFPCSLSSDQIKKLILKNNGTHVIIRVE